MHSDKTYLDDETFLERWKMGMAEVGYLPKTATVNGGIIGATDPVTGYGTVRRSFLFWAWRAQKVAKNGKSVRCSRPEFAVECGSDFDLYLDAYEKMNPFVKIIHDEV